MINMLLKHRHLSSSDTGTDIAHPVVIADMLMLIVRISLTCLSGIIHNLLLGCRIRTDQSPATRSRNHLISIKGQDSITAESSAHLSFVTAPHTFRSILNHRNLIFIGHRHDLIYLSGHTIQIYGYNRFRLFSRLFDTVQDGLFQQYRIHIPGFRLGIYKNRSGSQISYGMRRSTESKGLHQDFITRSYSTGQQRQMHCRCSR